MAIAKAANLALSFLLELGMLAAFGYWGFNTGGVFPLQVALSVGAPVLAALVWGVFLAPASARRLSEPLHQLVEALIFGLAFTALVAAGQPLLSEIFLIVYALNLGLRMLWQQ